MAARVSYQGNIFCGHLRDSFCCSSEEHISRLKTDLVLRDHMSVVHISHLCRSTFHRVLYMLALTLELWQGSQVS
jgi:hypothetical protein